MAAINISAIVVGSSEGFLAASTLASFWSAVDIARTFGLVVEPIFALDRPSADTQIAFNEASRADVRRLETSAGDPAVTRNFAVQDASGANVAFLDGDDLWAPDWLVRAHDFLASRPGCVAHPEYNLRFGETSGLFRMIDQDADEFDLDVLRLSNYWDALCLCPTEIYRDIPFQSNDLGSRYGSEDWLWNCETIARGVRHKIVPGTTIFKRSRSGSVNKRTLAVQALLRNHALSDWSHPLYGTRREIDGSQDTVDACDGTGSGAPAVSATAGNGADV